MSLASLDSIQSDIRSSEQVVLYPSFGRMDAQGNHWQIVVQGSVFEPGPDNLRKRILLRLLRRVLKMELTDMDGPIFQDRIRGFLVVTERGKRIAVRVGSRVSVLSRKTRRSGHFHDVLNVAVNDVAHKQKRSRNDDHWIEYEVASPNGDGAPPRGRAQLIGPKGISVISDIDDTIKISQVYRRRALLTNTFLKPFRPVTGMAPLYRHWQEQGAVFHYISSMPWQLYEPVRFFCDNVGFPDGTYHLRSIRLRDPSVMRLFIARRRGKYKLIHSVLRAFPGRQFILVGDSGEKDPEIYGALARRFPRQIARIFVRELPKRRMTDERRARAFRGVPKSSWCTFRRASELPRELQ